MVEINNPEGKTQQRRQSRRAVRVRGLPRHLSCDDIRKYFEVTGRIKYMFREKVDKNDQFSGACRITYEEEKGAREAVLGFDGRKFSYGHVMSLRMDVSGHANTGSQTIAPSDWVCQACSARDFSIVNFDWQSYCFSCGQERGKNGQQSTSNITTKVKTAQISSNNTTEVRAAQISSNNKTVARAAQDEYIEEEEQEEQDSKLNIPQDVTPLPVIERNDQRSLPSLEREEMEEENDQICLPSLEEELEDVLLNTFMNHRAFSESVPLRINISVGKAIKIEPQNTRSKSIYVNLSVTDDLINKTEHSHPQQQEESIETETLDIDEREEAEQEEAVEVSDDDEGLDVDKENEIHVIIEKPSKQRKKKFSSYEDDVMWTAINEADGKVDTKKISDDLNISHVDIVKRIQTLETGLDPGKKKFTLAQDKEIIDKVVEVLPGKSLPTLEIPDQVLKVLSLTMSRTESSVSARWKGKLRLWLIQYYNKNKRSWKDFSVKASLKRREDISKYFHKQAKKNGLTLDAMNVKRKK